MTKDRVYTDTYLSWNELLKPTEKAKQAMMDLGIEFSAKEDDSMSKKDYPSMLNGIVGINDENVLKAAIPQLETVDLAGLFAQAMKDKKQLKAKERQLNELQARLSKEYLDRIAETEGDLEMVRINGYSIFPTTEFSVKFIDPENGPESMLSIEGFNDLPRYKVDSRSLAKRVKDKLEENGIIDLHDLAEIEPELFDLCEIKEFVKLTGRSA